MLKCAVSAQAQFEYSTRSPLYIAKCVNGSTQALIHFFGIFHALTTLTFVCVNTFISWNIFIVSVEYVHQ